VEAGSAAYAKHVRPKTYIELSLNLGKIPKLLSLRPLDTAGHHFPNMEVVDVVFTSIPNSKPERWRLPPTSPPEKKN